MQSSISTENAIKSRRVSNAYMLVKDKKKEVVRQCPDESKNVMGAVFGAAWRSLGNEEMKAYFEKYQFLKKLRSDNYEAEQMKPEKESETNFQLAENSNTNLDAIMDGVKNDNLSKRTSDEAYKPSEEDIANKKIKIELMSESTGKDICPMSASTSRNIFPMSASTNKIISSASASINKSTSLIYSSPNKSASQMPPSTNKNTHQVLLSTNKNVSQMSASFKKRSNKPISQMSASTNKHPSSAQSIWKQKPKKKRRCNAYLLFCQEKRGKIEPSYIKDKKCHSSTVLSQMWKNLPSDEKKKYEEKANPSNMQNQESASSSGKTKILKKKIGKKSAGRPFKKAKPLIAANLPNLRSMITEEPEIKREVASDVKSSSVIKKEENTTGDHGSWGSQASTDVSNGGRQQTNNDTRSLHQFPSTSECNQPTNRFWNTMNNLYTAPTSNDFGARLDSAMTRPSAGAGFAPPLFMPFPITNSFWMMCHQMQMLQQMYMQPFSQSYCCNLPCNNYYQNAFLPGRNCFPYYNAYQLMMNSAASSNFHIDESARATTNERNSEDELVIVDEGNSDDRIQK